MNFFSARKHFSELCSLQKLNKKDFVCLHNIEITAKQVIQGYKKRKAYKQNKMNTEDTAIELLLLSGFRLRGVENPYRARLLAGG